MNTSSINKLRRRFIFAALMAYLLVALWIGALIYGINALTTQREIRTVLNTIVTYGGILPEMDRDGKIHKQEMGEESEDSGSQEDIDADSVLEEPKGEDFDVVISDNFTIYDIFAIGSNIFTSSENHYQSRYFSLLYDSNGALIDSYLNKISYLDEESADELYGQYVLEKNKSFGKNGAFFYEMSENEDGSKLVVYLDCTSQILYNGRILYSALILVVIGFLIIFILVRMFSYNAVKPEIENAELQKRFITNASHELKTPLAVIRANTEVEQMMNGENEWNQSTMRQVDRMSTLIQNLVLIAKGQESEDKEEMIDTDVSEVINSTVETFKTVANTDEKELTSNVAEGIHMTAEGSSIRQLATLLIDNAIKYCDDNGKINVSLSQKGKVTRLEVSNTYAEGKDVDYSKFFERFYRQDESHTGTNNKKGGYGIGLSIAEAIVKRYKGNINASWKDGVITFTCLLK